ncbi:amidohydrolase family protein [Christensenella intestinihominis]|uniref:amidohydrolase family protein n=1 Tax=Christensenella intestinihominis TaxID=1851429 RepID=UPI000832D209|nr:amidohydrolase family protein [Christensenella intestinihominis]
MSLFEVTDLDRNIYDEKLRDFLPEQIIDIHTHVYLRKFKKEKNPAVQTRVVAWPEMVARDNSIEDLMESYGLMFPGKDVKALIFSNLSHGDDGAAANRYVSESSQKSGYPALYFSYPFQSAEEIEREIISGGFLGLKSYLSLSPEYIPEAEIRIFDFFPPHQLDVLDRHGWIMMLHIPRNGRLKDPVNIEQILEIKQKYPGIKLIIAHIGRAYTTDDIGDAFERLAPADDLLFDFTANCNQEVIERLIEAVGPKRILFGSDLPILRMRTHRITENGTYVNLVPPGMYGDVSKDSHMREVGEEEGKKITFFMYEEILAFKRAAASCGLRPEDVKDVFYGNAKRLIDEVRK